MRRRMTYDLALIEHDGRNHIEVARRNRLADNRAIFEHVRVAIEPLAKPEFRKIPRCAIRS